MNMKLTNISLAVLVALGLVACGGSDSNDNAPKDKGDETVKTPIETPDVKDTETEKDKVTIENNGKEKPQDPHRAAPSMSVEKNLSSMVAVRKELYIDRQSRDAVAGYNGTAGKLNVESGNSTQLGKDEWEKLTETHPFTDAVVEANQGGLSYNPGSTDKADVLRASSMYNYFEEQSKQNALNEKGGIHANPAFSYAKGEDDRYYRVKPAGDAKWDTLDANSKFEIVADVLKDGFGSNYNKIPMSEVVFFPNLVAIQAADKPSEDKDAAEVNGEKVDPANFKNGAQGSFTTVGLDVIDPTNIAYFNLGRGEVQYKSFDLAGHSYDLVKDFDTKNIKLDLSQVPVAKEIQTKNITLHYDVVNNQGTGTINDDETIHRTAEVGAMKLYNLPYSRSSITINQQAVADANNENAAPNNLFNFNHENKDGQYGAFQIAGFQTTALPRDGRADYVGKSYGVNSEGDIELRADFAIDRAEISGDVTNRKTVDGKRDLPNLVLGNIQLAGADHINTASMGIQSTSGAMDGVVTQAGESAGAWAVGLYGPNAEEAAGVIDLHLNKDGGIDGPSADKQGKDFEVFSTQRGTLGPDSLNPGVGN